VSLAAVPPVELEPSELWLALTTLPRPSRVVPFPRVIPGSTEPVGELRMWPLTQEEQMASNAEADRWTKKLLKDPQQKDQANLGYHHTYANEVAIQVLWRACRNAKDVTRAAFPSPNAMRAALSTDEVGVLFANYTTLQQEIGPIVAYMTAEEQEGFILRLHAGGSAFPFDSLSWEQQRTLVSGTASRLVSCWMAMCSVGLPLDVTASAADQIQAMVQAEADAAPQAPQEALPGDQAAAMPADEQNAASEAPSAS
jgi:hypothetical protein